jgi:hypothetical protein
MKIYEIFFITPGYSEPDCVDHWISMGIHEEDAWSRLRLVWEGEGIYSNVKSFLRVQIKLASPVYNEGDAFQQMMDF